MMILSSRDIPLKRGRNMELIPIREEWVKHLLNSGSWPDEMLGRSRNVAILLTQDWCPQWTYMKEWLDAMETVPELSVFYVLYNRESYFMELMSFKESRFGNDRVPYVQYFQSGKKTGESNAVSQGNFLQHFFR